MILNEHLISYIDCDVLVIGSGVAGCRSAIAAAGRGANTLLVTKGEIFKSGTTFFPINYGFGIQAHTEDAEAGDSIETHYQDVIKASRGLCNKEDVRVLVEQAAKRLREIEEMGIVFDKETDGKNLQELGCYSSKRRCFQITGIEQYSNSFGKAMTERGVRILEKTTVVSLLTDEEEQACIGAIAFDNAGKLLLINAKTIVLATGGGCDLYKHSFTTNGNNGDGYALALKAGANIRNLEFIQFGWGLLSPRYKVPFLDRLLRYNPLITDAKGEPIYVGHFNETEWIKLLKLRAIHFPFTSEDEARVIDKMILDIGTSERGGENGGVFVHCDSVPLEKISKAPIWPIWYNWLLSTGLDPMKVPLEVSIFAHAFNGGAWINKKAETTVVGLYAAGETVSGPHGADRLGGNMQLASQVFGAIAGENAAEFAKNKKVVGTDKLKQNVERIMMNDMECYGHKTQYQPTDDVLLKQTLWENVLTARTKEGLSKALAVINGIEQETSSWVCAFKDGDSLKAKQLVEKNNNLLVARGIVMAALERDESRGAHYRLDFPNHNEEVYFVTLRINNNTGVMNATRDYISKSESNKRF